MIDICDFAVDFPVSNGLTMHSERPGHRMYEQYHPMGTVGISAFNFPVAVWAWNTAWLWFVVTFAFGNHQRKQPVWYILSEYYC
jgi:aldehyde dehydrogenase (NAD+)